MTGSFDGKRAQKLRAITGIRIDDVAARLGVKKINVRDWEAGRFEPTDEQIVEIAKVLHCKPDDIRRWKAPRKAR